MQSSKQGGFTLLEIMLVIALLFVLGLMSAAFYSRFYLANAVANTTDKFTFTFRKAQHYSMIGKRDGNWGVAFIGSKLILFNGTSSVTRNTALDEVWDIPTSVSVAGFNETVFARISGFPNVTSTIAIRGAGVSAATITINAHGVVSGQ